MKARIKRVVMSDPAIVEIITGWIFVVFGGVLLWPFIDTFTTSHIYDIMHAIASEVVWGVALLAWGLIGLFVALLGSIHHRRVMMFCSSILLAFMTTSFIIFTLSTSMTYAVIVVADIWAYVRLGRYRE